MLLDRRSSVVFVATWLHLAAAASAQIAVQTGKLFDATAPAAQEFGSAIALVGDTLVVGAPGDDDHGPNGGAVFVYARNGAGWSFQAKLVPADNVAGDRFGEAVALDGDTLLVGASADTETHPHEGSAYVFVRAGATWTQQAKLVANASQTDGAFGGSLDVEGDSAVIGARRFDEAGRIDRGAAFVFTRSAAAWSHAQRLNGSVAGSYQHFGASVALYGARLVVGSPGDATLANAECRTYVFELAGGVWSETAILAPSGFAQLFHSEFGHAVDVDGDTIVVGAPRAYPVIGGTEGRAYVFEPLGGVWTNVAEFGAASPQVHPHAGSSVSISKSFIAVGASDDPTLGAQAGRVIVARKRYCCWDQYFDFIASDGASGDQLGLAVANDGSFVAVGAPFRDEVAGDCGAVYAVACVATTVDHCTAKVNSLGCTPHIGNVGFEASVSGQNYFVVDAVQVLNSTPGILFYGFNGRAEVPFLGGYLCVAPPRRRTPLRMSSVGAPGYCDGQLIFDVNAWIQSGADPSFAQVGLVVNAQWWYRDPGDPTTVGLTSGLEFGVGP